MRDLVTEISWACKGDSAAMDYLKGLTREEWEQDKHALGQFLQEGPLHEPDWLANFAEVFEAIMDHHGRDVLTQYLESSSALSRSAAVEVLAAVNRDKATWAVDLIDAVAADEEMPLYARNGAAKVAAQIAGRPWDGDVLAQVE